MTKEELQKIPFRFVAHISTDKMYYLTYSSEDGLLGYCDRTPRLKHGQYGKTRRHGASAERSTRATRNSMRHSQNGKEVSDESAREIDKAISGCLMMVGFFFLAIIMCVIINMCSHG